MLNVYFWNKNEKMFQKDLNSDLKEKTEEQVLVYVIWYANYVIILFFQSDIYIKFLALYVFAVGPWKEVIESDRLFRFIS